MSFAIRGVLEGFYDRLWTWDERARVARFGAAHDFTAYVYAPKEERGRNAGWRTPASGEDRAALATFAGRCHADGMELWTGLRPLRFDQTDPRDLELVVARLRADLELGADRILLLADDLADDEIGSAGTSERLGQSHARLVVDVLDRLGIAPGRLAFCPTDYAGSGSPYLAALGHELPSEVDVCWTGRDVVVPTISAAEADAVGRVLGRPPLVWENYPVNDAGMVDQLHIGPVRGRGAALAASARGLLINAALQPEATLIPIGAAGEYLRDPVGYDPDAAFSRAVNEVAGHPVDAEAIGTLARALDRSVMRHGWPEPPPDDLRAAVRRVRALRNRLLSADLEPFLPAD